MQVSKTKLRAIKALIVSKTYALVTDTEGHTEGDFRGFTGTMKLASLRNIKSRIEDLIKQAENEVNKKSKTTK